MDRVKGWLAGTVGLFAAAALSAMLCAAPAYAGNQVGTGAANAAPASVSAAPASIPANGDTALESPTAGKRGIKAKLKAKAHAVRKKVGAIFHKLSPRRAFLARRYRKAMTAFPGFCQNWQAKLEARNVNNLNHLAWQEKNGWQTAEYTSYGKITRCETKESTEGIPIGKLSYEEFDYYIAGQTRDQALHAKPKTLSITDTLEIFRYDHGKWFY